MKLFIKHKLASRPVYTVTDSNGAVRWTGEWIECRLGVLNAQGDEVARIWKSDEEWVPLQDCSLRRVEVTADSFAFAFQEYLKLIIKKVAFIDLPWHMKGGIQTKYTMFNSDVEIMRVKKHMLAKDELFIENPQMELQCVCVILALDYLDRLRGGDGSIS